jgi:hypothetical protein
VHRRAAAREAAAAGGEPYAGADERADLQAVALSAGQAVAALAAPRPADDDLVALLDLRHAVADRGDDARALVPEDTGEGEGERSLLRDGVGVADPAGHDLDEHLARERLVDLELLDVQGLVVLLQDGGRDLHRSSLLR